jgi:hypothetical protein
MPWEETAMQTQTRQALAMAVPVIFALPLLGQSITIGMPPPLKSYTAEFKITTVQTLADGTNITRETKEMRARDSEGRTRLDMTTGLTGAGQEPITQTTVSDPVTGTTSSWTSRGHFARVEKLPAAEERTGCWESNDGSASIKYAEHSLASRTVQPASSVASPTGNISGTTNVTGGDGGTGAGGVATTNNTAGSSTAAPPRPAYKDLGADTIMGVEVHGSRTTFTMPVGMGGNDRPIVRTRDLWTARGFDIPFRSVDTSLLSGKSVTELVSLDLGEPAPATFQPPEGMEVRILEFHRVECRNY